VFVRSDNKFLTKLEKRGIRPIAGSMIDTAISVHLTTVGISYKTREMRRFGHHTNKSFTHAHRKICNITLICLISTSGLKSCEGFLVTNMISEKEINSHTATLCCFKAVFRTSTVA